MTLSTEHRAAASQEHIPLQLTHSGSALALSVVEPSTSTAISGPTPLERVRQALAELSEPAPVQQLRKRCGLRTATVCAALEELSRHGEIRRDAKGYQLQPAFPVSHPIDPPGNGNGKLLFASAEDRALQGWNPSAA